MKMMMMMMMINIHYPQCFVRVLSIGFGLGTFGLVSITTEN